jgi:hypothetical protein
MRNFVEVVRANPTLALTALIVDLGLAAGAALLVLKLTGNL